MTRKSNFSIIAETDLQGAPKSVP